MFLLTQVECTFGIIKERFRLIHNGLTCQPHIAKLLMTCAITLRNYQRIQNPRCGHPLIDRIDDTGRLIKGNWRIYHPENEVINPHNNLEIRGTKRGEEIRAYLSGYCYDEQRGGADWQWEHVEL